MRFRGGEDTMGALQEVIWGGCGGQAEQDKEMFFMDKAESKGCRLGRVQRLGYEWWGVSLKYLLQFRKITISLNCL